MRVYEKHPTADAYRVGASYTPYAIAATDKRFSGAELAAEYHKQGHVYMLNGGAKAPDAHPQALIWDTLYRFATLPNFDEES